MDDRFNLLGVSQAWTRDELETNGVVKVASGDLESSGIRVLVAPYAQLIPRSLQFEHCGFSPLHF